MRVILDSNIFLSALISQIGIPHRIYDAWLDGAFELICSEKQVDEIRRVSRYSKMKAFIKPVEVGELINRLRRAVFLDKLEPSIEADDPDDSFLLSMAVEADADYLVTGDYRAGLLTLGHIKRTKIVTASVFYSEVFKYH